MRSQRNQNNLDFFAQLALLIWRGQWGWFWLSHRLSGSLYRLICHLGLFVPLPCFMRSRRVTPLLDPSLVFSPRRFA
jgi:hypothetical protein